MYQGGRRAWDGVCAHLVEIVPSLRCVVRLMLSLLRGYAETSCSYWYLYLG